ncbi:MAG TPA: cytochrome c maturation protein CcmE [Ignavibacteria bacterium]|nr:cytochrome c maturation protein CcmE [Ignavibacteria bacterium]
MKNKYLFGGGIIVVFLVLMSYLFTQTNVSYQEDFSLIMNTEKTVRATGEWVKSKSYQLDNEKKIFSFYMKDYKGNEMRVVYNGVMPNNFESSTSVVVTGKYHDGYFYASDILTKCPSKYEEQFDANASS